MASILVLGIGNILLRDEGVGVHVVQEMTDRAARGTLKLPDDVELVDGGTFGIDLLDTIAGRRKVIVIDAVEPLRSAECGVRSETEQDAAADNPQSAIRDPQSAMPGAVLRFTAEDLARRETADLSLHQVGLFETLAMARQLGSDVGETVILGIVPKTLESGLELSPEVAAAVPKVIELVMKEIKDAGPYPG